MRHTPLSLLLALSIGMFLLAPSEASGQSRGEGRLVMPGLQSMPDGNLAPATLRVFQDDGQPVADAAARAGVSADVVVALPEGWYIVSVGNLSSPGTLARLYVAADHTTIVPTGWVEVTAVPLSEQSDVGCDQWDAQLGAFELTPDGGERAVSANRSGAGTFGAVQLLPFPHRVYFNGVPTEVDVQPYTRTPIVTGLQEPITGDRPQLLVGTVEQPTAPPIALCEDGATQVPAGSYFASAIVPVNTPPYERREWVEVRVEPTRTHTSRATPRSRVSDPIWDGEGSTPVPLGAEHAPARQAILAAGTGARRLSGFGD